MRNRSSEEEEWREEIQPEPLPTQTPFSVLDSIVITPSSSPRGKSRTSPAGAAPSGPQENITKGLFDIIGSILTQNANLWVATAQRGASSEDIIGRETKVQPNSDNKSNFDKERMRDQMRLRLLKSRLAQSIRNSEALKTSKKQDATATFAKPKLLDTRLANAGNGMQRKVVEQAMKQSGSLNLMIRVPPRQANQQAPCSRQRATPKIVVATKTFTQPDADTVEPGVYGLHREGSKANDS